VSGTFHTGRECTPADPNYTPAASALVAIAGSAGAFPGLCRVLGELPPSLKAAVAVMLHTGPESLLASALAMRSRLPVYDAVSGDLLRDGCVYVAQPQTHLVVNADARLTVSDAPRVRLFRPSADWLFESAAASFTNRLVAVVLSGMLSDGARQLHTVKRLGGTVLVQDPSQAAHADMPAAAVATGCADLVVGIDEMSRAISEAVARQNQTWAARKWASPFDVGELISRP
jgi:chemotaxis response regulator CheB